MNSKLRRETLRKLAAAGLLGSAGLTGLIGEALAYGAKPIAPGVHKVTGNATINGQPARPGMAVGSGTPSSLTPAARSFTSSGRMPTCNAKTARSVSPVSAQMCCAC